MFSQSCRFFSILAPLGYKLPLFCRVMANVWVVGIVIAYFSLSWQQPGFFQGGAGFNLVNFWVKPFLGMDVPSQKLGTFGNIGRISRLYLV